MVRVEHADCVETMRALPAASVDAIVTDPPYGLEFMGKDWDSFAETAPRMTATQRADHMNRSESFGPWGRGDRPIAPNDYGHRNEKCLACGRWRISSNRCRCPNPRFELRIRQETPPAMRAFQTWTEVWAREALRVLKPGGHLVAMGGTRTYHRLVCAIEDAGFEIRDCICWLYGTGFPKSLNVSKAIDKAAGADREVVETVKRRDIRNGRGRGRGDGINASERAEPEYLLHAITVPATAAAAAWSGWGTALKPAFEPIVLARKPLVGTVAENVMRHGTGAINIDGCRIEVAEEVAAERVGEPTQDQRYTDNGATNFAATPGRRRRPLRVGDYKDTEANVYAGRVAGDESFRGGSKAVGSTDLGRWPANVVHDSSDEVLNAFPDAPGMLAPVRPDSGSGQKTNGILGKFATNSHHDPRGDKGSAARFFFSAKAGKEDRWGSKHPTVKPVALIRWLMRLVTPPGGTVLDPFAGSGTAGVAALAEGFDAILIEREPEYIADIRARLAFYDGNGAHSLSQRARNRTSQPAGPLFSEAGDV